MVHFLCVFRQAYGKLLHIWWRCGTCYIRRLGTRQQFIFSFNQLFQHQNAKLWKLNAQCSIESHIFSILTDGRALPGFVCDIFFNKWKSYHNFYEMINICFVFIIFFFERSVKDVSVYADNIKIVCSFQLVSFDIGGMTDLTVRVPNFHKCGEHGEFVKIADYIEKRSLYVRLADVLKCTKCKQKPYFEKKQTFYFFISLNSWWL